MSGKSKIWVESSLRRLAALEKLICFIAFFVLALVIFLDVMLREILGNGLAWAQQVGVYANIVVAMIGIGVASNAGSHLRPRFADHWVPQRLEPLMLRIQDGVMALFCISFFSLSGELVLESYQLAEVSTVLRTPVWPVQSLIPLAFLIGFLRHGVFVIFPDLRPDSSQPSRTKGSR